MKKYIFSVLMAAMAAFTFSSCEDFYHANKDFDKFNKELSGKCNVGFNAYSVFDQNALMERSRLLYEIVKVIWEVS